MAPYITTPTKPLATPMELSTSAVVQAVSLVYIYYTNLVLSRLYFSIVVVRTRRQRFEHSLERQWFEHMLERQRFGHHMLERQWFEHMLERQRFGHSLERQWFEHLLERQWFGHLLERQWGLYKQYMQCRSVE